MNRIKKELAKLKRENQQLRKMLSKADIFLEGLGWEEDEDDDSEKPKKSTGNTKKSKKTKGLDEPSSVRSAPKSKGKCPSCKGQLEEVELGSLVYEFCADRLQCGYRKKLK